MIGPRNGLSRIFRDLERSNKYVLLLRGFTKPLSNRIIELY